MTHVLIDRTTLEQMVVGLQRMSSACELEGDNHRNGDKWYRLCDDADKALTAGRAALAKAEPTGWQKIETAPKDRTMFVVRGFNVAVRKDYHYDTDPYCVWATGDGFKRWPHPFKPTHWMPLPASPKDKS